MNRAPYQIADLAAVIAMVAVISWALAWLGPALDDLDAKQRSAIAAADAEQQAQAEFRKELAEAAMCRQEHGESMVTHTASGETVCIPRGYIHRRNQLASNP